MISPLNPFPGKLEKYIFSLFLFGTILNFLTGCSSTTKTNFRPNVPTPFTSLAHTPSSNFDASDFNHFVNMGKNFKSETSPAEYEELGDKYYQQGNLHFALTHYKKAAELNPSSSKVQFKLGVLFLDTGNIQEARKQFDLILEKNPHHALAHEGLARTFYLKGDNRKANYHFHLAAGMDPSLWRPHFFLGLLYNRENRHALAIIEFQAALDLQPSRTELYNDLGMAFYLNKQFYRAIYSYRQALKTGKPQPIIFNNLGLTYASLGKYRDALKVFSLGGDPAKAYNNLGVIFLQNGHPQSAIGCFVKAIALHPSFYDRANENLKIARENIKNKDNSKFLEVKNFSCDKNT